MKTLKAKLSPRNWKRKSEPSKVPSLTMHMPFEAFTTLTMSYLTRNAREELYSILNYSSVTTYGDELIELIELIYLVRVFAYEYKISELELSLQCFELNNNITGQPEIYKDIALWQKISSLSEDSELKQLHQRRVCQIYTSKVIKKHGYDVSSLEEQIGIVF